LLSQSDSAVPGDPSPTELGFDREDYNAVLRYGEMVGEERLPAAPASRNPRATLAAYRTGAGLLAGLLVVPLAALLAATGSLNFASGAGLALLAGILGAGVGHELTRRELQRLLHGLSRRMGELLGEGHVDLDEKPLDLGTYLGRLNEALETALEGQIRSERDAFISTISSLVSALEARDPYTRNHSSNVAKLSAWIGREMHLSHEQLYELHLGGLLHDVGKIGIRDDILLKPAGLSREEYEIMKTHPELGARMLSGLPGFEEVAEIVLHHHEMYDGRGYPDGLEGKEIPLGARIVAIADTYLSLVEDRPYREGRPLDKVVAELQRVSGKQFDPDVLDAFFRLLEREHENNRGVFTEAPARKAA